MPVDQKFSLTSIPKPDLIMLSWYILRLIHLNSDFFPIEKYKEKWVFNFHLHARDSNLEVHDDS